MKIGGKTIIFSDNAMNPIELKLIQQIRSSADTFQIPTMEEKAPQIDFYHYYDTRPHESIKGIKIDLNQAYWQQAINIGLVTPEIQYYFVEHSDELGDEKTVKMARLRSLGALATKKTIQVFQDGEIVKESLEVNEPHRQLYLYLCEKVAEVMHTISCEFIEHVIYYYWDCIFLDDRVSLDAVNKRIQELGFDSKVEGQGEYRVVKGETVSYLHDIDKGIKYPINNEHIIK